MKNSVLLITLLFCISFEIRAWLGVDIPTDENVITSFGNAKEIEIEKNIINVFVWNIFKANKDHWKEQFSSQISSYDFFLLQEMLTKPDVLDIFSLTEGLQFTTATSFIYKKNNQRTGVATGTKYFPIWSKFLRSEKKEPILSTPKVTLFTKYPIKGNANDLLIVNIHAINFVSSDSLHSQLKDASKVIYHHPGPVIFAGDFNTWTQEKQDYLQEIVQELNMKEVVFKDDARKKIFGFPLDFIFVKDLDVISSKVHNDLNGSDHYAISAQLKFK